MEHVLSAGIWGECIFEVQAERHRFVTVRVFCMAVVGIRLVRLLRLRRRVNVSQDAWQLQGRVWGRVFPRTADDLGKRKHTRDVSYPWSGTEASWDAMLDASFFLWQLIADPP